MSAGSTIRKIRERKGWTQHQLAKAAGCGLSNVSQWETGRVHIKVKDMEKLLNAMGYELYTRKIKDE